MKILLDMNLSPSWVQFLEAEGVEAIHWSAVGSASASDREILAHAEAGGWIVFTHDLDFSRILALTSSRGPSVLQLRTHDVLPDSSGPTVVSAIQRHREELGRGAIVVVDPIQSRVRLLPLG